MCVSKKYYCNFVSLNLLKNYFFIFWLYRKYIFYISNYWLSILFYIKKRILYRYIYIILYRHIFEKIFYNSILYLHIKNNFFKKHLQNSNTCAIFNLSTEKNSKKYYNKNVKGWYYKSIYKKIQAKRKIQKHFICS